MGYVLGVDFGTSFTAAVAHSGGVSRVVTLGKRAGAVPTATFVREDGSLIHGEDAYLVGVHDPERLVRNLKRRLADSAPITVAGRTFSATELTSAYLRWVVDAASMSEGGPPDRLLFTHPANWRSVRLEQFRGCLAAAGLADVSFAAEPFAAAAFHSIGNRLGTGDLIGVYDLGGGTFDAAVLRRTATGFDLAGDPEGIEHLGGVDFDDVLFHLVRSRVGEPWAAAERKGGPSYNVAVAGIRRESVAAKEALSVDTEVEVPVMLPGVNQVVKVTRTDFERLIAPSVQDTIGAFRRSLRQAGVSPAELSVVLLVGGSVALGVVRSAVRQVVGDLTPVLDADPKYAVARGAALLADHRLSVPGLDVGPTPPPSPTGPAPVGPAPGPPAHAAAGPPADASGGPPAGVTPLPPPTGAPLPSSAGAPLPPPVATPQPQPLSQRTAPEHAPARAVDAMSSPPKRAKVPVLLGAAAVIAVLAGVTAFALTRGGNNDEAGASRASRSADGAGSASSGGTGQGGDGTGSTLGPGEAASTPSGQGMSEIAAGSYTIGLDPPGVESIKARSVTIDAFYLDTFEVTNVQYDSFVQTVGAPPATSWPGGRLPDGKDDHPVEGVEFVWAQAYCAALSKRLPTEAEWEAAARGTKASLYPWGDDRTAVDIDRAGSRPVGSSGNVSEFGVHDTVASAWEWVDEPYEPVSNGQRVRHGGANGRVRDGAAMRQAVDPANRSVVAETGFRCAADDVDAGVEPGAFNTDLALPEVPSPPTTAEVSGSGPGTVVVDDNFEQRTSGFRSEAGDSYAFGYYAPSWYHLEATGSNVQTVSTGGYSYSNASIETHAHVDGTLSGNGRVRYGLVVRATGNLRQPLSGAGGPSRSSEFVAFTIDPRAGEWALLQETASQPLRVLQSGPLPAGTKGFDGANPDGLRVEMRATVLTLFVNDTQVAIVDIGATDPNGDVGFFVENIDETFADVHFADLKITEL